MFTQNIQTGTSIRSNRLRLHVKPVTGDINGHGDLEQKHVTGIEAAQGDQKAHGAAAIGQLVQKSSELGA